MDLISMKLFVSIARTQNITEVIVGIANYYFKDVLRANDEAKN